jgi:hypothetical protein
MLKYISPKLFTLSFGLWHLISSDIKGTAKLKLELFMPKCSGFKTVHFIYYIFKLEPPNKE